MENLGKVAAFRIMRNIMLEVLEQKLERLKANRSFELAGGGGDYFCCITCRRKNL